MNLNAGKSDNNLSKILKNPKLSRASLQRRAKIKNDIDDLVKKIISWKYNLWITLQNY